MRLLLFGICLVGIVAAAPLSKEVIDGLSAFSASGFELESGIVPHGLDAQEHKDLLKAYEERRRSQRNGRSDDMEVDDDEFDSPVDQVDLVENVIRGDHATKKDMMKLLKKEWRKMIGVTKGPQIVTRASIPKRKRLSVKKSIRTVVRPTPKPKCTSRKCRTGRLILIEQPKEPERTMAPKADRLSRMVLVRHPEEPKPSTAPPPTTMSPKEKMGEALDMFTQKTIAPPPTTTQVSSNTPQWLVDDGEATTRRPVIRTRATRPLVTQPPTLPTVWPKSMLTATDRPIDVSDILPRAVVGDRFEETHSLRLALAAAERTGSADWLVPYEEKL